MCSMNCSAVYLKLTQPGKSSSGFKKPSALTCSHIHTFTETHVYIFMKKQTNIETLSLKLRHWRILSFPWRKPCLNPHAVSWEKPGLQQMEGREREEGRHLYGIRHEADTTLGGDFLLPWQYSGPVPSEACLPFLSSASVFVSLYLSLYLSSYHTFTFA